jgi:hypothetical protein
LTFTTFGCGSSGSGSPAEAGAEASVDGSAGPDGTGSGDSASDATTPDSGDSGAADSSSSDSAGEAASGGDSSSEAGSCGIDCGSNGVCISGRCTTVLTTATSGPYADGLAVDSQNLYVTTASDPRCIFSLPLAGGSPAPLVTPQITPNVSGSAAVTLVGSTLYWTTGGGMQVFSVAAAGGAATTVSSMETVPQDIVSDGTRVYWTDWTRLRYTNVGSATPTTLPIAPDGGSPFQSPTGIAVDSTYVYWSNQGSSRGTATIWRANKMDGSNATQLVMSPADSIQGITIDATTVYFTSNYGGGNMGVYSIPIGGGPATTLSSSEMFPTKIASDADAIYWLDGERVRKMSKAGGPSSITTLSTYGGALQQKVSGGGTFNYLTVDSTYVYFTQSNVPFTVYRVTKN